MKCYLCLYNKMYEQQVYGHARAASFFATYSLMMVMMAVSVEETFRREWYNEKERESENRVGRISA